MDDKDKELIALLRHNSRLPVSTLAPMLDLSRITVKSRIDRLVKTGKIQKFTLEVSPDAEDNLIRAITNIEVQGLKAESVVSHLKKMAEITNLHSTNGKWALVAISQSNDLASFDKLLNQIGKVPGVVSAETSLLLTKIV
ncbi:MAG: Lrp/AsnC family transcriptional regulator [Alphaproteobacteria bacterium]